MRFRPLAILVATSLVMVMTNAPAIADNWTLLIQPAPYSATPPEFIHWQSYKEFSTLDECITARNQLHSQSWATDRDLSQRALAGVCANFATGQIATDFSDADGD